MLELCWVMLRWANFYPWFQVNSSLEWIPGKNGFWWLDLGSLPSHCKSYTNWNSQVLGKDLCLLRHKPNESTVHSKGNYSEEIALKWRCPGQGYDSRLSLGQKWLGHPNILISSSSQSFGSNTEFSLVVSDLPFYFSKTCLKKQEQSAVWWLTIIEEHFNLHRRYVRWEVRCICITFFLKKNMTVYVKESFRSEKTKSGKHYFFIF